MFVLAALLCGNFPLCAFAQAVPGAAVAAAPVAESTAPPAEAPPAAPAADPCTDCITIPALTVVTVEIMVDLGSKISKSGDTFPIRLAAPIVVNGVEIVPAGVTGMGEVIHAKRSGGSGAAGELVLAARYLEVDGRRLRLRSMNLSANGRSNINTAFAISAVGPPVVGFLIKGKQANVPAGTIADAKTAEAFSMVPMPAATAPEAPAAPAPAAPPETTAKANPQEGGK
ncbi:hypothetical protein OF829_00910 [Sphingomonas sp. LB-2]|uniref:hypothetical protein n=1 Tax=Sphingomonas caeni TaxID=2984949 RepID=UPI00223158AF|nr:hypothetical protein [Sphingomonas caeni]MCW3845781.1 hypothetical protein [Sphingomonas caeni]